MELRDAWLEQTREEILEPGRPIVDPHFHFFEQTDGFPHYRLADLVRDTAGHRVEQAVFMQCREGFRTEGPEHLRPVGETEWIDRRAREAAAGPAGAVRIAGLIADARLCNGALARETLEAHREASPLFRGVRELAIWDPSPEIDSIEEASSLDLYGEPRFREGFAELAKLDLVFDAHLYHTQLPTVASLARAFPDTTIVVDHLGSPLGAGPYKGKQDEVFPIWQRAIREIAACPNIVIKLGGLAMPWCGFGLDEAEKPPTSDQFVATFGRYYDHALQCFGPDRCMFESNFPVDRFSVSYDVLWNAFKKIAAGYSEDEKESLFRATATRVYRLDA